MTKRIVLEVCCPCGQCISIEERQLNGGLCDDCTYEHEDHLDDCEEDDDD